MKLIAFTFQEGTSLIYALLILGFALIKVEFLQLPPDAYGMFVIAAVSLAYLSIQMAMAAFAQVGQDRPLVDLFFSFFPFLTIVIIIVLAAVNTIELTLFHGLGLMIAGAVVLMDIVFNTQVLFKINRLATDFVQMK